MEEVSLDITKNVAEYLKDRSPEERLTSFDYCYNYFQVFYENNCVEDIAAKENIHSSCLHIGFFLASWGMFRGSTILSSKSVKHFERLVVLVSKTKEELWSIDVNNYTEENIKTLLDYGLEVQKALGGNCNNVTDTLVTKTMLGILGNVPALDTYIMKGFGVDKLRAETLEMFRSYYEDYKTEIDSIKVPTIDFLTSQKTNRYYPKIKIIDMVGWIEGRRKMQQKSKKGSNYA